MPTLPEQIDSALTLICMAQSLFFVGLLRAEGPRAYAANRWLQIFLIAMAGSLCEALLHLQQLIQDVPALFLVSIPLNFLLGPSIILYLMHLAGEPPRSPWLHLLALLTSALLCLPLFLLPTDVKLAILAGQDISDEYSTRFLIFILIQVIGLIIQTSAYIFYGWRLVSRYRARLIRDYGDSSSNPLHWMLWVLGCMTLVYVTFVINELGSLLGLFESPWMDLAVTASQLAMVFLLGYRGLRTPVMFIAPATVRTPAESMASPDPLLLEEDDGSPLPDSRPALDEALSVELAHRLRQAMEQDRLYLDPLLTLPRLAQKVGAPANTVSAVLNQHLGLNFFDFVNGYRVEAAARLLLEDRERTILDIAMDVGFNSKSTFNAAFKKLKEVTPSSWRDQVRHPAPL